MEIHAPEPQWLRSGPNSVNDVEPASPDPPELPTPQREGLKLTDRARGYEYTLKTHIVPAAWPRSTPDVGYPAGCGVDGLQERRGSAKVREEMLKVRKKYMKGELPGGKDERQYWVCVNRYVRNGLEERDRKGRKRLTLFLTHGIGFEKEASTAEYLILCTSLDFFEFVVLGASIAASTVEPRRGRSNHRRGMVV